MEFPPLALHYQCALFTYDFKHQPSTDFFLFSPSFLQFYAICESANGRRSRGPLGEEEVALLLSIAFLSFLSHLWLLLCTLSPKLAAAAASFPRLSVSVSLSVHSGWLESWRPPLQVQPLPALSAFLLPFPLKITFITALVHSQVQKFHWCLFKITVSASVCVCVCVCVCVEGIWICRHNRHIKWNNRHIHELLP